MGFILSKIFSFFNRSRSNFKIIILGVQNAGKTTILYRLSLGQVIKTTPTIGSNVEEIKYNNVKFQAWDLGGQESARSVWDVYYFNTDAIIYVIDSKDDNYEDSKAQFYKLLTNETLKNAVILVFANKQDLPGAKSANELIQLYELDGIKDHIWHIQACSAQTGEGLITGIKWLSDQLVFRSNNNFPNNPYIEQISEGETTNQNEKSNAALPVDTSKNNNIHKKENNEKESKSKTIKIPNTSINSLNNDINNTNNNNSSNMNTLSEINKDKGITINEKDNKI